jgi:hypothetical protein
MELLRHTASRHRQWPPRDDLTAAAIGATRVFMRAALTYAEPNELGLCVEKRIATWLFSLGAIRAVAELNHLDGSSSHELALHFFGRFYQQSRIEAAESVSTLIRVGHRHEAQSIVSNGKRAMLDWLDGKNAPRRLRETLDEARWMNLLSPVL